MAVVTMDRIYVKTNFILTFGGPSGKLGAYVDKNSAHNALQRSVDTEAKLHASLEA